MSLQKNTIKLHLNSSPEVLERVLRVTRHRGFEVKLMHWNSEESELELTVTSERDLHLLTSQLDKLFDVNKVTKLSENSAENAPNKSLSTRSVGSER